MAWKHIRPLSGRQATKRNPRPRWIGDPHPTACRASLEAFHAAYRSGRLARGLRLPMLRPRADVGVDGSDPYDRSIWHSADRS